MSVLKHKNLCLSAKISMAHHEKLPDGRRPLCEGRRPLRLHTTPW